MGKPQTKSVVKSNVVAVKLAKKKKMKEDKAEKRKANVKTAKKVKQVEKVEKVELPKATKITGIDKLYRTSLVAYDKDDRIIAIANAIGSKKGKPSLYSVSKTGVAVRTQTISDQTQANISYTMTVKQNSSKRAGAILVEDIRVGGEKRKGTAEDSFASFEQPTQKKRKKEEEKKEEEEDGEKKKPKGEEEKKEGEEDGKGDKAGEEAAEKVNVGAEEGEEAAEKVKVGAEEGEEMEEDKLKPTDEEGTPLAHSKESGENIFEAMAGKSDDPPNLAQNKEHRPTLKELASLFGKFLEERYNKDTGKSSDAEGDATPTLDPKDAGLTPVPEKTEEAVEKAAAGAINEVEENTEMSDTDKREAVAAIMMDTEESVRELENTKKALKAISSQMKTDEMLSGGEIRGETQSSSAATGYEIVGTVAGTTEVKEVNDSRKDKIRGANPMDVDRNQRVIVDDDNRLLSNAHESVGGGRTDQTIAASANSVAVLEEDLPLSLTESIAAAAGENRMDTSKDAPPPKGIPTGMEGISGLKFTPEQLAQMKKQKKQDAADQKTRDRESKEQEAFDEEQQQINDKLQALIQEMTQGDEGAMENFNDLMAKITPYVTTMPDDINISQQLQVANMIAQGLREKAKVIDVMTAKPSTQDEIVNALLQENERGILTPGKIGSSGLGAPVFAPDEAVSRLHTLQKTQVLTLTAPEAQLAREQMQPFWNEFKRLQMNAGVHEMEAMPTRLLKDAASTLRIASAVRPDVDLKKESFMKFMFYILHTRLDASNPTTWRHFFLWSASLGYGELTQAQINWLVTGNWNGDIHRETDWRHIKEMTDEGLEHMLDEEVDVVMDITMSRRDMMVLSAQMTAVPAADMPFPGRNVSPSAPPRDHSIHPNGTDSRERRNRETVSTTPHSVFNIPDPRFSTRGGESVPNTKIVVVKNPKWDSESKLKPGDPKHEPEFITQHVPDVGVGSKDVEAAITAAEADRLLDAEPVRLYAPIHSQACDRYLGSRNYQRLSLEVDKYLKNYSQHGWTVDDFAEMFNWNLYVMQLYGSTLYAFVTDIKMQRVVPVFTVDTPRAVVDEYMELNELVKELTRYQQESTDRASRVSGGGASTRPLDEQLGKFFKEQDQADKDKLFDANAITISFPDQAPPGDDVIPDDDRPGPVPDDPPAPADPDAPPVAFGASEQMTPGVWEPKDPQKARMVHPQVLKDSSDPTVGPLDMDRGITLKRRTDDLTLNNASRKRVRHMPASRSGASSDLDRRANIFNMFNGVR